MKALLKKMMGRHPLFALGTAGLAVLIILNTFSEKAMATDHFEITKEMLFRSDMYPGKAIFPTKLARLNSANFLILGRVQLPWAAKVDPAGNSIWQVHLTDEKFSKGEFFGAIGNEHEVFVLGQMEYKSDKRSVLLLSKIENNGKLVAHQEITPQIGASYSFISAQSLNSANKLIVAISLYSNKKADFGQVFYWFLSFDPFGNVTQQRLIARDDSVAGPVLSVEDRGDGHLVVLTFNGSDPRGARRLLVLNEVFEIKRETQLDHPVIGVKSADSGRLSGVLALKSESIEFHQELHEERTKVTSVGKIKTIQPSHVYQLSNGDFAIFGSKFEKLSNVNYAGIEWMSSELSHSTSQALRLGSAVKIADAIPTGKNGEFLAVREKLVESLQSGDVDRAGMLISFVQFK